MISFIRGELAAVEEDKAVIALLTWGASDMGFSCPDRPSAFFHRLEMK